MSIDFVQTGPELSNPYRRNKILQATLRHYLGDSGEFSTLQSDLTNLAQNIVDEVDPQGRRAELNEPKLISFSPWGKSISEIEVSPEWKWLHRWSAKNGLIADGYERRLKEKSRLAQMAKLHLFHPSSAFYSCPLAMTDGAAKVLEIHKTGDERFMSAFHHLTSRDENVFWTSGQWMTEKTGGSDVSGTSTIATPQSDGSYSLSGIKWFSSATTSEMALGLAKVKGSDKLSLFFIPMRKENGELNGIEILRLKEKMGTKALPTAELKLEDCQALLIGEPGKGVKNVATMLNITRLYNSVCSIAQLDRGLQLLSDYSKKRTAFGKPLIEQALHTDLIAEQKAFYFAGTVLTFEVASLLGKEDTKMATEEETILLRLLTPLTKLYTAKKAIQGMSEILEGFGGAGYIEDTRIPTLFKDAQVFPIWEGATHVLSLDLLRVMAKHDAMGAYLNRIDRLRKGLQNEGWKKTLESKANQLKDFLKKFAGQPSLLEASSKNLSFYMSELLASHLMATIAEAENSEGMALLTSRMIEGIELRAIPPNPKENLISASV